MADKKLKDLSIETLRGLAILLVVAGYIIHNDITRSLGHTSVVASILRFFYYVLTPIRMPLFTVISAYLYAASPTTRETFKKLVSGKARRIMIPFLAASTIQYLVFWVLPMEKSHYPLLEIYKVYIWPHQQLWFLYSIFEIFIIIGLMDSFKLLATPKKWLFCLGVSLILHVLFRLPETFSVQGIIYLMPFFILGYGMRIYSSQLFSKKALYLYSIIGFFGGLFWTFLYIKPFLPGRIHQIVGLIVSFSAVPLLFHFRREMPVLAKIGYYAFGIHIFNRIAVSATRSLFEHYHYHNTFLQFTVYMTSGVILAVGLQILLEQFSITRKYILGLKD